MAAGLAGRTTAALALTVAVLSGCSEEQPANDSLPSASAETTSSEALPPLGPADLPMPAEARTQDGPGAEAFVRYYIDLINRTSAVMDAGPLREFSEQCVDCERIARDTEEDASAGYHYEGGELSVTWLEGVVRGADSVDVSFVANQAPFRVINADGEPVPELTSEAMANLSSGALTHWDGGRHTWVITTLTLG